MKIITFIEGWNNVSIVIRLVLATLLGSVIGLERSSTRHMAGLRTFALVCLGSAAATILNIYMSNTMNMNIDPSRISAQVISGIGFLGAGTILVTGKNQVKGLTTAASLWASAIMGMAIGAGFIVCAVTCFLLIITTIQLFRRVSRFAEERSRVMDICVEVQKDQGVTRLRNHLSQKGYHIITLEKGKQKALRTSDVVLNVEIDINKKQMHQQILEEINDLEYVNYLEEM